MFWVFFPHRIIHLNAHSVGVESRSRLSGGGGWKFPGEKMWEGERNDWHPQDKVKIGGTG